MDHRLPATPELAREFSELFVNRRAYTIQSMRPHPESGRHYYYRPKPEDGSAAPSLHQTLADGALWYGTPFDGDTTLMPELPDVGEHSEPANLENHNPTGILRSQPDPKNSH